MEEFDAQLGPFFRHIRKRRGLTIRDVAVDVSETAISRFERGQIDLTITKLVPSIEAAEIDAEDLLLQANQAAQAFNFSFHQIQEAVIMNDEDMANAAIRHYNDVTQSLRLPLRQFNRMILKYLALTITDPLVYMAPTEQEQLLKFITADADWHHFEYLLVNHLIYFMDAPARNRCLRLMRRSFKERRHPADDQLQYENALVTAMRRPLATRDLDTAHEIAVLIRHTEISPLQTLLQFKRQLCLDTLAYLDQPTSARIIAIDHLLTALAETGSSGIAAVEARWLRAINIPITYSLPSC